MDQSAQAPETVVTTLTSRTLPNFRPPIFWKEVREHYLKGEGSTRALADEFGISISTIQARCRREGWVQLREIEMDW